jgi:hypothetical protein
MWQDLKPSDSGIPSGHFSRENDINQNPEMRRN